MRRMLALAALAAMAAGPAAAEPVWSGEAYEYGSALSLGIADSPEEVTFSLYCDNDERYLELAIFVEIPDAEPGQRLEIALAGDAGSTAVRGETATDEMSGFVYGSATGFKLVPVLRVLRSSGPVTVTMGAVALDLPADGRAAAVRAFAMGCRLP